MLLWPGQRVSAPPRSWPNEASCWQGGWLAVTNKIVSRCLTYDALCEPKLASSADGSQPSTSMRVAVTGSGAQEISEQIIQRPVGHRITVQAGNVKPGPGAPPRLGSTRSAGLRARCCAGLEGVGLQNRRESSYSCRVATSDSRRTRPGEIWLHFKGGGRTCHGRIGTAKLWRRGGSSKTRSCGDEAAQITP